MTQQVYNPAREELFYVAGNREEPARDPATGRPGVGPTYNLARGAVAHPLVRYADHVLETDLHVDDQGKLYLLLICPKCRHQLRIHQDRKAILYRPELATDIGGELSVERFECTWEESAERREFGLSRCTWRVAIDKNRARDA